MVGLDRGRSQQSTHSADFPYIKMNNITMDGRVILTDTVFISASKEEQLKFAVRDGDLLFNTRNSFELVGKTGIVRNPTRTILYNNNLMRIRLALGILPNFVCSQMCSPDF